MNKTIKEILNKAYLLTCATLILTGVIGLLAYVCDHGQTTHPVTNTLDNPPDLSGNLITSKPVDYRRLNSNGVSQRYIPLSGDRTQRIKGLIAAYGFNPDEAWPAIRTIARIYHVYPEAIICIAYADSSIGRFLKTNHNYGNVGNNDRGNTQEYDNFEQGMNAIGKVLNNRYLGSYVSVNQLSRYGNLSGMVYASSPENRHINVMNCLSMIHNKKVPDNFAFRF